MLKKRDIILAVVVLLLAGMVFLFYQFRSVKTGAFVVVEIDGEQYARYSLDQDAEYVLGKKEEGAYNVLQVKEGTADITEADCRDKICVRQAPISKTGETIVCLPHKLVVSIEAGEEAEVDSVVK